MMVMADHKDTTGNLRNGVPCFFFANKTAISPLYPIHSFLNGVFSLDTDYQPLIKIIHPLYSTFRLNNAFGVVFFLNFAPSNLNYGYDLLTYN